MPLSLEIITPEGVAWSGKDIDSVVMPARNFARPYSFDNDA